MLNALQIVKGIYPDVKLYIGGKTIMRFQNIKEMHMSIYIEFNTKWRFEK